MPHPESRIERTSVLVLAGSAQHLEAFEEIYAFYHICQLAVDPVLIVGSGRVGDTIAERFKEHGRPLVD
jgi:Trk K+ transport system NAD-binding subunit